MESWVCMQLLLPGGGSHTLHEKGGLTPAAPSGRGAPLVLVDECPVFTLDHPPWILLSHLTVSPPQLTQPVPVFQCCPADAACFSFMFPFLIIGFRDVGCCGTGVGF